MTYAINQLVRLSAEFRANGQPNGALVDPSRVEVKILAPDATLTSLAWPDDGAVVRDSIGVFHVDVLATVHGTWTYRFTGKGAAQAAQERNFTVDASRFATP